MQEDHNAMDTLAPDLATMTRTPLTAPHVAAMRAVGDEKTYPPGTDLARLGDPNTHFCYLLEGEVEALDPVTGERYGEATLQAGQFFGEISFLNGGRTMLGARTLVESRILEVPRAAMLRLMSEMPEMSDIVVTVFAARRRRLLESNKAPLTLIGADETPALR
ncbi:MAG: cyclic nucleotide-binding domain-containing protein, partial [Pseudomonadota bacterium]